MVYLYYMHNINIISINYLRSSLNIEPPMNYSYLNKIHLLYKILILITNSIDSKTIIKYNESDGLLTCFYSSLWC